MHNFVAHDLCSFDDGGFRDPYVRVSLVPEVDQRKRQTQIHRGETHPYYDDNFKFPISRDQLQNRDLVLQVLDYDRYSHNDVIGELRIRIDDLELARSTEIWGDLVRMKKPADDRPELLLSLNYLPQAERLTVVIMKAKNLETFQVAHVKVRFYSFTEINFFLHGKVFKLYHNLFEIDKNKKRRFFPLRRGGGGVS